MKRTWLTLIAALGLAVATAGCGEVSVEVGNTIDSAEIEEQLQADASQQLGTELETVECPEDIPAEKGYEFECQLAAADGRSGTASVTLTDDQGSFDYQAQVK